MADLASLYATMDDREMREQLIFVYSQRDEPAAVDKLLDIAARGPDAELRKKALFWLGQSEDPRPRRRSRTSSNNRDGSDHDRLPRAAALALLLLPAPARRPVAGPAGQAARTGLVRLSFASRPGVCGKAGTTSPSIDDGDNDWESDCEPGPVRVSLRTAAAGYGARPDLRRRPLAGAAGPATDLGLVPAREAAADLLLARRAHRAEGDDELVSAATLADSAVVWPALLRDWRATPRCRRRPGGRRSSGWARRPTRRHRGLDSIVRTTAGDLEVRKHAVFALSQRPADEGVPALIRSRAPIRTPSSAARRSSGWARARIPARLALFEELLR